MENINQTAKVLQQKTEVIPDLKTAFKEASVRFEEATKAREQKKKVDELKKELAWAHVAAKENVRLSYRLCMAVSECLIFISGNAAEN